MTFNSKPICLHSALSITPIAIMLPPFVHSMRPISMHLLFHILSLKQHSLCTLSYNSSFSPKPRSSSSHGIFTPPSLWYYNIIITSGNILTLTYYDYCSLRAWCSIEGIYIHPPMSSNPLVLTNLKQAIRMHIHIKHGGRPRSVESQKVFLFQLYIYHILESQSQEFLICVLSNT